MLFLTIQFTEFIPKADALFAQHKPHVEASGQLGTIREGKCIPSYPNETLISNPENDWCSNIAPDPENDPWIQYYYPQKSMQLTGFSIRNGCCYHYECCCNIETGEIVDYFCCCYLNKFFLQGSNDNRTWKTIYHHENEKIYRCQTKTFNFDQTQPFHFIRIKLEEPREGCKRCMQVNQVELYGKILDSPDYLSNEEIELDESVSIIGKVKKY